MSSFNINIPSLPPFPDIPSAEDVASNLTEEIPADIPNLGFQKEFIPEGLPCAGITDVLENEISRNADSLKSTLATSLKTFSLTFLQDVLTAFTGEASLLANLFVGNIINQVVGPLQGFTSLVVLLMNADNIAKYAIATMLQEQLRAAIIENNDILGEINSIIQEIYSVLEDLDGRFNRPYDENLFLLGNAKNEVDEAVVDMSYAEEYLENVNKLSSRYLTNAQTHTDGAINFLTSGAFSDIETRIETIQKDNPDLSYDKAFSQAVKEYRLSDIATTDEAKFWEAIGLSITSAYSKLAKIIPLENLGDDWAIGELFNQGETLTIKDLEKTTRTLIESNGLVNYTVSAIKHFDVDWSDIENLSNHKGILAPITNQKKALQSISNNMGSYLEKSRGSSDPMLSASFIGWTAALEGIKQSISIIVPASEVEDELKTSADSFNNLITFLNENPNIALDEITPSLIRATVSLLQIIYNPQLTKQALAGFGNASLNINLAIDWNNSVIGYLDTLNFDIFENALTSANANLIKKIFVSGTTGGPLGAFNDAMKKLNIPALASTINSILSAPAGIVWGIVSMKDLGMNLYNCITSGKDFVSSESTVEELGDISSISTSVSNDLATKSVNATKDSLNKRIAGVTGLLA